MNLQTLSEIISSLGVPFTRKNTVTGVSEISRVQRFSNGIGILFSSYDPAGDESDADSDKLRAALYDAYQAGLPLIMPPGRFRLAKASKYLTRLRGVKGKTTIVLTAVDKTDTFNHQFALTNPNFSNTGYNALTADIVEIVDVDFEVAPQNHMSIIGLANVKGGVAKSVRIIATKVINPSTGNPYICDALIDMYAAVKNFKVTGCDLQNITCGRGAASPWAEGGGGEIWVRNLLASDTLATDANATENIEIYNNRMRHLTSDESIAVYGVVGKTRNVRVFGNAISGLDIDVNNICYHGTLLAAFPLRHATLGANSAVEDVRFTSNTIDDRSWFYSVVRFGNAGDGTNICRNIKSAGNTINAYRSTDSATKPHKVWTDNSSAGVDPDLNCLAMRAIQNANSFGSWKNAAMHSESDTLICSGDTTIWGFSGFDSVIDPTTTGSVYYSLTYCTSVSGGNLEATACNYYNCGQVTGGDAKVNLAAVANTNIYVDANSGRFCVTGVRMSSAGGVARMAAACTANTSLSLSSNNCGMTNASAYAMVNASATATMRSHLNFVAGSMAGGTSGTIVSSLNSYAGTIG